MVKLGVKHSGYFTNKILVDYCDLHQYTNLKMK